ncbi:hypothetical protein B0A50_07401 [Salinomyces thailandicus]|uniref:Uncharacterized protein n=1 Tax=Salinomyces thailandicus TaxID=706561 RepID=A0A4U0TMB9_9PEZI|nr:hypothetical protein B0A50_07401 [Salinomyces thailandica]
MEPSDLFSTDRSVFDAELAGLIRAAAASSTTPASDTMPSPYRCQHSKYSDPGADEILVPSKRESSASPTSYLPKRVKVEQDRASVRSFSLASSSSESPAQLPRNDLYGLPNIHPSRLAVKDNLAGSQENHLSSPACIRRPSSFNHDTSKGKSGLLSSSPPVSAGDDYTRGNPRQKTWLTSRNAVRRQWDTRKDDLEYDNLLELRRTERVNNVDRYVPSSTRNSKPSRASVINGTSTGGGPPKRLTYTYFPFTDLPSQLQDRILTLLLAKSDSINIDFTWLRPFINGHARLPTATTILPGPDNINYTLPIPFDYLVHQVGQMQTDFHPFIPALEAKAAKSRHHRSPCKGLTTALLRTSNKRLHAQAAKIFYSTNTFRFPWPTTAWLQLAAFLSTIGPTNLAHLSSLRLAVPQWHRGVQADFLEGAVLDLTSPASRLAVLKPPAHDRLLSAIKFCTAVLQARSPLLSTLTLDLEYGRAMDTWTERYQTTRSLITLSDAEEHVTRKARGIEVLRRFSESLAVRPVVRVSTPAGKMSPQAREDFAESLERVGREAAKYGWVVDRELRVLRTG